VNKKEIEKEKAKLAFAQKMHEIVYENITLGNEVTKWEKAFNIVMEYSEDLPDFEQEEIDKRLKAIGIF
jgi:sulfur transfer protein SufE